MLALHIEHLNVDPQALDTNSTTFVCLLLSSWWLNETACLLYDIDGNFAILKFE